MGRVPPPVLARVADSHERQQGNDLVLRGASKGCVDSVGRLGLPLVWWFSFVFVLGFACVCLSVLLHRQWADHEKLVYPALTPILEMTAGSGSGKRWLPEFMQGRRSGPGLR